MTHLRALHNDAGSQVVCRSDGTLALGSGFEDVNVLIAGIAGGKILLEAPTRSMRVTTPGSATALSEILCYSADEVSSLTFILRDVASGLCLRLSPDGAHLDATRDDATRFRGAPVERARSNSLLAALPHGLAFDQETLSVLFALGDTTLHPVVEALLPVFHAGQVRDAWSTTSSVLKAPFLPVVREHARERVQRYGHYTIDRLKKMAEAHGWSIGEKTYGTPLIFEPTLGKLTIGRYCSLADPSIILGNHDTRTATSYPFVSLWFEWPGTTVGLDDHISQDVVIGNDVWIGHQAIILPGARIGDGCVIAAGCVVSGRVPPYSICVGNPGRARARRFRDRIIERLLRVQWWDWPDATVDRYLPLLLSHDIERFLDAAEEEFGLSKSPPAVGDIPAGLSPAA